MKCLVFLAVLAVATASAQVGNPLLRSQQARGSGQQQPSSILAYPHLNPFRPPANVLRTNVDTEESSKVLPFFGYPYSHGYPGMMAGGLQGGIGLGLQGGLGLGVQGGLGLGLQGGLGLGLQGGLGAGMYGGGLQSGLYGGLGSGMYGGLGSGMYGGIGSGMYGGLAAGLHGGGLYGGLGGGMYGGLGNGLYGGLGNGLFGGVGLGAQNGLGLAGQTNDDNNDDDNSSYGNSLQAPYLPQNVGFGYDSNPFSLDHPQGFDPMENQGLPYGYLGLPPHIHTLNRYPLNYNAPVVSSKGQKPVAAAFKDGTKTN